MKLTELAAILIGVLVLAALLVGGLGLANSLVNKIACDQLGRRTGSTTIYEFPSGCYKLVEGKWKPITHQTYDEPEVTHD